MSTILVVDGDELVRDVIVHRLRKAGHDVIAVADGDAAVTAAKAMPFDLVLLDAAMPGLPAVEVCRRLRGDERTRPVAIVMMTERDHLADVERAFAAGADEHLSKPFSTTELVGRVDAILAAYHDVAMTPLVPPPSLAATFDALRVQAVTVAAGSSALADYLDVLQQVEAVAEDARVRYEDLLDALQVRLDVALSRLQDAAQEHTQLKGA